MTPTTLRSEASKRLRNLSPERLRVANNFLAYLQELEESEATRELLGIPGFEEAFNYAVIQVKRAKVVRFDKVRRNIQTKYGARLSTCAIFHFPSTRHYFLRGVGLDGTSQCC